VIEFHVRNHGSCDFLPTDPASDESLFTFPEFNETVGEIFFSSIVHSLHSLPVTSQQLLDWSRVYLPAPVKLANNLRMWRAEIDYFLVRRQLLA